MLLYVPVTNSQSCFVSRLIIGVSKLNFFLLVGSVCLDDYSYFTFDSISIKKHLFWRNLFSSFCHWQWISGSPNPCLYEYTFNLWKTSLRTSWKLTLPLQLPILIIGLILRLSCLVTSSSSIASAEKWMVIFFICLTCSGGFWLVIWHIKK